LLRVVSAAEQGELRLIGSDRVRYAVYDLEDGRGQAIYLLNTDPDYSAPARLWMDGRESAEFLLPANEFVVTYRFGSVLVLPMDRRVNLQSARWRDGTLELALHSVLAQEVCVENLGPDAVTVALNGSVAELAAGALDRLPLERSVPPDAFGYEPEFADEPAYEGEINSRTAY